MPQGVQVQSISLAQDFTVVLGKDNKLYGFGSGSSHGLGLENKAGSPTPVILPFSEQLPHLRIKHVACGTDYTVVLTEDGAVYTFGTNDYGQCGHGNSNSRYIEKPRRVGVLAPTSVVTVDAGEYHTAAVTADGQLYTWVSVWCACGRCCPL